MNLINFTNNILNLVGRHYITRSSRCSCGCEGQDLMDIVFLVFIYLFIHLSSSFSLLSHPYVK